MIYYEYFGIEVDFSVSSNNNLKGHYITAWATDVVSATESGSNILTPRQQQYLSELNHTAASLSCSVQDLHLKLPPSNISQRLLIFMFTPLLPMLPLFFNFTPILSRMSRFFFLMILYINALIS